MHSSSCPFLLACFTLFPPLCRLEPGQLRRVVLGFTSLMDGEATLGHLAGQAGLTEERLRQVLHSSSGSSLFSSSSFYKFRF